MSTRKLVIDNTLKIGLLKMQDFLSRILIHTFSQMLPLLPLARTYPHKKNLKEPFISFGEIVNTDKHTDKQVNECTKKPNLLLDIIIDYD